MTHTHFGLGDFYSKEQLITRWKITLQQYRELVVRGLPAVTWDDGTTLHNEVTVNEWFRRQVSDSSHSRNVITRRKRQAWCHPEGTERPSHFAHGPLEGNLRQLAFWIFGMPNSSRRLKVRAVNGEALWIYETGFRSFQVWFRSQTEYLAAKQRRSCK
jgi:hypothetical protein